MELLRPRRELAFPGGVFLPGHRRVVVRHLSHRDALLHRAHRSAQITPNARFLDDLHDGPAIIARQAPDRLMRAVFTRGPAQLALDAFVLIDVREQVVIQVEVFPLRDARERPAADVRERAVAAVVHPVRQPVGQVLHDAEAVVHYGGADLERPGAQGDELGGIAPRGDATDPGDRNLHRRITGDGGDEVQGDRLHRRPAVAAVARFAGDRRLRLERRQIDTDNGVDGIDQ